VRSIGDAAAYVVAKLERLEQQRKIASLPEFEIAATQAACIVRGGLVAMQDAADDLLQIAADAGLVARYGIDRVQARMDEALAAVDDEMAQRKLATIDNAALDVLAEKADAANATALGLQMTAMSAIASRSIEWLWPQRIAIGKFTMLAGEGGLGKSTVLFDIAARMSRGHVWPDGTSGTIPQSVFILSSEDDPADTIRPRLQAAGADLDKVYLLSMVRELSGTRQFSLQADLSRLEDRIREVGDVALVIVDPLTAYLGKVDSNSNADVRSVLGPLSDMAARTRTAMIGNTHFAKSEGRSANQRVLGSVAFVNASRQTIIVTPDPDDKQRRLFLPSKTNISALETGLAFRIAQTLVEDAKGQATIVATRVAWDEKPVTMSANAALAALGKEEESGDAKSARDEAAEFLREVLAEGPKPAREVITLAEEAGHSQKLLRSAREKLGIKPQRSGFQGGFVWALPMTPGDPLVPG
jgi:putative DNA primase/helicase